MLGFAETAESRPRCTDSLQSVIPVWAQLTWNRHRGDSATNSLCLCVVTGSRKRPTDGEQTDGQMSRTDSLFPPDPYRHIFLKSLRPHVAKTIFF